MTPFPLAISLCLLYVLDFCSSLIKLRLRDCGRTESDELSL